MLAKQRTRAFGKDIFLLGEDKDGIRYWLEAPTWACGWYWGFGYIETYTNNQRPGQSRDINSHQHATNFLSDYAGLNPNHQSILIKRTFTDKEGWELADLFQQFYLLRDMAEYCRRGHSYISKPQIELYLKPDWVAEINEQRIPLITNRILDILTPPTKEATE